jgi:hypothetical protein
MAVKPKSKDQPDEISILEITTGMIQFAVLGESPLIFNRMSEKAKRELLLPRGRLTTAAKAVNVKHDPIQEYRDSVYRNAGPDPATRLKLPSPSFKGALCTAALDIPGARKSEIGRLVWVPGTHVDIYGVPQLFMGVVRSADISHTPDIRTRAILPRWAGVVTIRFVQPKLTGKAIASLMAAAGIISGVGDFRQEKGKGNFGQFRCVDASDEEFLDVIKTGGREAQDEALHHFTCYDEDSEELLQWYEKEIRNRGRSSVVTLRDDGMKDAAD